MEVPLFIIPIVSELLGRHIDASSIVRAGDGRDPSHGRGGHAGRDHVIVLPLHHGTLSRAQQLVSLSSFVEAPTQAQEGNHPQRNAHACANGGARGAALLALGRTGRCGRGRRSGSGGGVDGVFDAGSLRQNAAIGDYVALFDGDGLDPVGTADAVTGIGDDGVGTVGGDAIAVVVEDDGTTTGSRTDHYSLIRTAPTRTPSL